ncbi:DNA polymerase III subunit alpha [subsurface metagenome]
MLQRLLSLEKSGLYVKLTYGRSFSALVRYAREKKLPLCAVNDAYYIEGRDLDICNILRAIDRISLVDDLPAGQKITEANRAVTAQEMERYFSAVPEALANAWALARKADSEEIISKSYIFPNYNGLSEAQSFQMLKRLCLRGAQRRYGAGLPGEGLQPRVKERLDYELSIIRRKGFSGYFLVVCDIVSRCPRTCGRGSSASSIVSYLLGITHVDPLRYNLFFERFLNMDRKDPPDIDVDFPWDEREKALQYVFKRYEGRAGMVADHVTFGPRSCLRAPARVLGVAEEEIKKLVHFYRHGELDRIPAWLLDTAERIRGFPHYLGTHCGGVVITPEPICHYTHLQTSPLGYPVIAWEKEATEDAGLVKIDLLGNRSLAVLRDTIRLVNDLHGKKITWEDFSPLDNMETREFIARGKTLGVFYVESPATRQLLKKMGRGDFENLVIASSIIRPAANRYIREFVKRLHGAPYNHLHPRLKETLKETHGIMVYQEDVSRVVMAIAGFSPGEADRLRKILSKKDRLLRIPDFREKFFRRGMERGAAKAVLKKIWDMILSFEGYSFCKAHSASYALVSYKLAYLKRFHALEFLASVINNGGGYYTRQTYLNECRRLGFRVLPPDVNRSRVLYTAEQGALRVGLGQIRDLNSKTIEKIVAERERRGEFINFTDFLKRVSPRFPELRLLIRSGSLDSISDGLTRPQLFWAFFRTDRGEGLFLCPPVPAVIGDYSEKMKLMDEVRTLGLVISRHPLRIFAARAARLAEKEGFPRLIPSKEIPDSKNERVSLAGLLVTGKEVSTKKKAPMVFVSFEDEHSVYETVFFPRAFEKYFPVIEEGGIFLLSGKVEEDLGALSINVERIMNIYHNQMLPGI